MNAGVDNDSYLGTEFAPTFPTVDTITLELMHLGPGAHLYKIDISRAFRLLKIDPGDYDLLDLAWDAAYVNTGAGTTAKIPMHQRLPTLTRS